MTQEAELLSLVQRTFPSWGNETATRLENLGCYLAQAWPAGAAALRSRGVEIPDAVHARLVSTAQQVVQTRQGGTTFLSYLRQGLADDGLTMKVLHALATIYARFQAGRSQTATPKSGKHQRVDVAGFEVYQLIGKGSMGRVFKAKQKSLDRVVALKVLDRSLAEEDPTFVERFSIEAKAVAQLQHPNIVQVIDQGTCPNTKVQFIAFEFVDGRTATDLIEEQGDKLPEQEALALTLAIAEALVCAEENGIVHRDVKPDNILIGRDGIPKLADLGLAKRRFDRSEEKDLTQSGLVVGTPQYMAPEQAIGVDEVDTRGDLYALGICLWHFLTGDFPFRSDTPLGVITMHINNDVPDPRTVEPGLSANVAELVLHLTRREREDRYPSAHAAVVDIGRVLAGQTVLGPARAGTLPRQQDSGRIRLGSSSSHWRASDILAGAAATRIELEAPPGLEPGDAALWKYARSGHNEYLGKAQEAFQALVETSLPVPRAQGLAGLARVHLLGGDAERAEETAKKALDVDPDCAEAVAVLSNVERGVARRAPFGAAVNRLSALVAGNHFEEARALSGKVRRDFPSEPHPHLVTAVAAHEQGDQAGFQEALQLAWALFPSKGYVEQTLGPEFDALCMEVLIDYGWSALSSGDPDRVALSSDGLDDKGNLVAGALRMAIGVGHAALAAVDPDSGQTRALLLQLARGFGGLQHFAAAQDLLRQISKLDPNEAESVAIEEAMRQVAGFQGVKQPGIKPKRGRPACPVGEGLRARLRERQYSLQSRCKANEGEVSASCLRVAEIAQDDAIKQEVRQAARSLGAEDPYAGLEALEEEQRQVEAEQQELAETPEAPEPEEGKKTGWFNKLKGAAGMAGRAAKQGQLKLKEAHLHAKHKSEVKAIGVRVVRELAGYDYEHPELAALTRSARRLLTTNAVLKTEEARLKDVLSWIAK